MYQKSDSEKLDEICDRILSSEKVLVIMAKRFDRLYASWQDFRRDIRGRMAGLEALILGKRKR